ncbi:MAG: hypothetical protein MPW16_14830 [Candidatus Manganitrophus sp.]|nr:MAG: hypothetical protein MPW16_14830 [Candidatus Manganitrophus sp.]
MSLSYARLTATSQPAATALKIPSLVLSKTMAAWRNCASVCFRSAIFSPSPRDQSRIVFPTFPSVETLLREGGAGLYRRRVETNVRPFRFPAVPPGARSSMPKGLAR